MEIKDKINKENLVADHLSCIVDPKDTTPIHDTFLDEHLFATQMAPQYANIVNYIVTNQYLPESTRWQKDTIKKEAKRYVWDESYLWKYCTDQII